MRRTLRNSLTLGVLALVGLVLTHHLIYLVAASGAESATKAVREGDGYWSSIEVFVAIAAMGLIATGSRALLRLQRQAQRVRLGGVAVPTGAINLRHLFMPVWARLVLLTSLLLLLQENLERFAVGDPLPGLGALVPQDCPLALLLVVGVSAIVALVASLVHWRTLVLAARLQAARAARPRATSVRSIPRPPDRRAIGPLLARGLGRRAPPRMVAA